MCSVVAVEVLEMGKMSSVAEVEIGEVSEMSCVVAAKVEVIKPLSTLFCESTVWKAANESSSLTICNQAF